MGEDCFGSMVVAGLESPMVKASFIMKAKSAFTLAAQQKRADKAARDNAAPGGAFNIWNSSYRYRSRNSPRRWRGFLFGRAHRPSS